MAATQITTPETIQSITREIRAIKTPVERFAFVSHLEKKVKKTILLGKHLIKQTGNKRMAEAILDLEDAYADMQKNMALLETAF